MRLIIEGILNPDAFRAVEHLLVKKELKNSLIVFAFFAECEIPIPHVFKKLYDKENPNRKCNAEFTLLAATTQLSDKLNSVPEGYKTICQLKLNNRCNEDITATIPIVGNWYDSDKKYILE